ncbi:enoyl-[acyl-carrier-protein] reductase FabV [Kitasatospora viridis]|uniref:trans-2-enoyl-CoA reductase (NAD(+)) n=1 Tax=Kitasatospora viridis TaxID=281105 RepID=A0A561SEQ5_9ACTN|nr:enoyl-[acyl-carrier-protein] reductase FabV [Kitasatospora viridis]TWF73330.1 enoyl-[acyl-carrier protein] reductase/trans-2-enoyl-CoA reductase (NAD+) [Kitasatospora viridis]
MSKQRIAPKQRGYLILNSHPAGCAAAVEQLWESIEPAPAGGRAPVVLVLGSSAGYGLSILLAGLRRHGVRGVGVAFEAPETERRTASAGWYRTAAAARLIEEAGGDVTFLNADAFAHRTRAEVLDLLADRYGPVDHLVYSLASPRRTDPDTGAVHHSVIKPLARPYSSPSLVFEDGEPRVGAVELSPADEPERAATVQVMGGADWRLWVEALAGRGLLATGFSTVALSYVGSEITAPVYRQGTIGAAKEHLERTARELDATLLAEHGGRARTVVAGAAVTQASTAIPSIALYTSLLRNVLGADGWRSTADQAVDLWDRLTGAAPLGLDEQGRIRLDDWELEESVQDRVRELWADPGAALAAGPAGPAWFHGQFRELYGWDVAGVDYAAEQETSVAWPGAEVAGRAGG